MRITWGSLGSWWLSHLLHPGFNAIAILFICLIPVIIVEIYFLIPAKTKFTPPELPSPDQNQPTASLEDPL